MKSELEEKRSSIKVYQQTYLEIESLNQQNNKTEAANKKLEAQVKKLEETTTKQSQDIKKLKTEKNILEKDLKRIQKHLEKTEKLNQQKVLKHAWTQKNATEETKIDKTKIKLLLEELWMCIEPSAQVSQRKEIQHFSEETGMHCRRTRDSQHSMQTLFPGSPLKNHLHLKKSPFLSSPLKDHQHCNLASFPGSPLKDQQHCNLASFPGSPLKDQQHCNLASFPGSPLKDQQHCNLASFPGSPLKDQQHCKNAPFLSRPLKEMRFYNHLAIPVNDLAASIQLHNLAGPEVQLNTKHTRIKHTQMTESSSRERDHFNEDPILNKETGQRYLHNDFLHVSGDEQKGQSPAPGQNLDEILDWFKPLPPLLSPVHFSLPRNQDTLIGNAVYLSEEEEEEEVKFNSNELNKLCEGDKPSKNPESHNEPSLAPTVDLPLVGFSNNTSSTALLFHRPSPCILTETECDDKAILDQEMRESNPSFPEESTDVQSDSLQIGENSDCFNSSIDAKENDTLVDHLQKETSQHSSVKVEALEDCVLNSLASDEGNTSVLKSDSEQLKKIQSLQEPESSGTEYMEVEKVMQKETEKDTEAIKERLINSSADSATLSHFEDIIENNIKSPSPVASDDQNMLVVDSPTKGDLSPGGKEAQGSSAKVSSTFLETKESEIRQPQHSQSSGTTNTETVNEASVRCFQKQEISWTGELSCSRGCTKNEVVRSTETEIVGMTKTFTVSQKPNLKVTACVNISDGVDLAKENELSHNSSEFTEDEALLTKATEVETVAVNGSVSRKANLTGTTDKPNHDEADPTTAIEYTNNNTRCAEDETEHLAKSEMLTVADTCSGLQKVQLTGTCYKPNTDRTDPVKENTSSINSSACNEDEVRCAREVEIKRTETSFSLLQKSNLTPNAYSTNPNGADRIITEKPTSYILESTLFTKSDDHFTTDVESSVEETSSDIIMLEERLCRKACPMTREESEDDQESFMLQRKVKKTKNKGNESSGLDEKGTNLCNSKGCVPEVLIDVQTPVDNKMSMNDNKALEMTEEEIPNIDLCEALKVKIDSKDLTTTDTSLNKHSDRSTSETATIENSELEQDEIAYKNKPEENMEICKNNIEVNGAECNIQVTSLDCVLTAEPDSQHSDNASDESLLCESLGIILSEDSDSENISTKDCNTNNRVSPPVAPTTETKEAATVPSHRWQHPATVQNSTKARQKEKEPSQTALPVDTTDTPTSSKHSPDSISKVRTEMGPPLRPLLPPLIATPPRFLKSTSPSMSMCSRSSFPSLMENLVSPLREMPITLMSPLSDGPKSKSPLRATPSPSDITKNRKVQTSPLQFCAATPRHAVPVPGRLPPSAIPAINSSPGMPQENSVRILDTMYPDLSARARTLNILKGNIQLNRCAFGVGSNMPGPVNQISGFKAINSSTAFTKTGKACEAENSCFGQPTERLRPMGLVDRVWKRPGVNLHLPKSSKKLRLDNDSPVAEKVNLPVASLEDSRAKYLHGSLEQPVDIKSSEMLKSQINPTEEAISKAFEKIANCCLDLMPVIHSHVQVGNISQVPVLRDEEKEVIHEFCVVNKQLADCLLVAILAKLKTEKKSMKSLYRQALCRVYVGICRQNGDLERARLFSYSILKEDFPESDKLTLFIASTWYSLFSLPGLINKAMQAVTRQRAKGQVLKCLSAYLGWEKNAPCDVEKLITGTLVALKTGVRMKFQPHDKCGEDLCPFVWEHIFATELLCSQLQWKWTHDNLICKELWPIMNKWVKQRKGIDQAGFTADITVAAVLRLIGRLGQLGLKKRYVESVKNVATVINTFGRHANAEGVPWGVQLATVYAIYDLAPSNPKEAMESLAAWRSETTRTVPPAVTSCITQMGSMCRQIR
ncbi:little elongation complex subunit 1-like isoform X1 [Polyodon spathula]|uniref:little elongation complex subunit 1-like isoform X1 n=1 Tax=Polyodon spathula TaxID=7913 RepID=UPI001B7DA507|nr:little elongation complex subunit 1-like isoform X1 [Polyodon spathula]